MSRASASAPDAALLKLVRARRPAPWTQRFSMLGQHGGIWLAYAALRGAGARERAERRAWLQAGRRVAGVYVLNTAIKFIVRRRRPPDQLSETPTQLSFPSAHAATSFAGARSLTRAGARPGPLYALAGALSLSRLRLGVHWPSDVLAGAVLGTVLG